MAPSGPAAFRHLLSYACFRGAPDGLYSDKVGELLPDEEIFMAIAEGIGFDATGKPTKVNELGEIGVALADFIKKEAES